MQLMVVLELALAHLVAVASRSLPRLLQVPCWEGRVAGNHPMPIDSDFRCLQLPMRYLRQLAEVPALHKQMHCHERILRRACPTAALPDQTH